MTARDTYDRWTRSLSESERFVWDGHYERTYPAQLPIAWDFLSPDEQHTWRAFARALTPRKERDAK